MYTDRRNRLHCAFVVFGFVLATVQILEMGVNDDWSYAYTAREMASSGRLAYDVSVLLRGAGRRRARSL